MKVFKLYDKVEEKVIGFELAANGASVCRTLANVGFFKLYRIEDIDIIETDLTDKSGNAIKTIDPLKTLEGLGFKREEPMQKADKKAEDVAKDIVDGKLKK